MWHTRLKKKLKNSQSSQVVTKPHAIKSNCPTQFQPKNSELYTKSEICGSGYGSISPERSLSELSSVTDLSVAAAGIKHEQMDSSESTFPVIGEGFWTEELVVEDLKMEHSEFRVINEDLEYKMPDNNKIDDDMDFWYNLFIGTRELPEF